MANKTRVLFLCTGNACRSQMAEALLRHLGDDAFEACSAGSQPAGFVHDLAFAAMEHLDIPLVNPLSKGWDEFADSRFEVVITLCDSAADETCPVWPGNPITVHWSMPDPTYYLGSQEDRVAYSIRVAERLRLKIQGLVEMNWQSDRKVLEERLRFLAEI